MASTVTINWRDGLSFEEAQEMFTAMNINSIFSPELHADLSGGANAGVTLLTVLQQRFSWAFPMLGAFIPGGDVGGYIGKMLKVCQMAKAVLDTP